MSFPSRVLVTGASGHVGGAIVATLARSGCEVIALSRRGGAPAFSGVIPVCGNIVDFSFLATLPRCEAVVHAAAALDKSLYEPALSMANAVGTHNLIAWASRQGVAQFVFISSLGIIGHPTIHPITEDHPAKPTTAYHASKLYGELLVGLHGGISLRITSPIGPGTPANRIFSAFGLAARCGLPLAVKGMGSRRQDYVDVRDIAAAVSLALKKNISGICNIGSGAPVSNLELAQTFVQELGSSSAIQIEGKPAPDDYVCWDVSIARAQEHLGYAPRHTLANSIHAFAD